MTNRVGDDDLDFEIIEIVDLDDDGPAVAAATVVAAPVPAPVHAAGPAATSPAAQYRLRQEMQRVAARELLRELLTPLDALESCVREQPDAATLEQGVRMALRSLWNVFRPFDLERIEGHGMGFDPRIHEAAEITPSAAVPVNTVLETLRVGYTLGGDLVRPALVRVSAELPGTPGGDGGRQA